jgi:magnesium chelatase accessory protein
MSGGPFHRKPDWRIEGRDWPNAAASRFVAAAGLNWHVQTMGEGPALLLLHGTGAATHSWRDLAPLLARDFTVVAPDLPGHGFTDTPADAGMSLPGMARLVGALLKALQIEPVAIVGHSAGAAIALRMGLDDRIGSHQVISLNGAFMPFGGLAGHVLPGLTRMMFLNPLAVGAFAARAGRPGAVERLIASTGSRIDARGLALYTALLRTTGHVAGALRMMANWDLHALKADLPRVAAPLTLISGGADGAVPPSVAESVRRLVGHAQIEQLERAGHLAHEEQPERVAERIRLCLAP